MRIALSFSAVLFALLPLQLSAQGVPGGFQHDSNQPIEISSDTLEVRQQEQTAVFSGSVYAVQGDVNISADRLIVSYDSESGSSDQTGAIRSVRADGNVIIRSTEETAQGDWAEYDVVTGSITMGNDVALTQGPENVLVGGKLFIDLNSGFARIEGGPSTDGGASSGRVSAIFTPPARGN